MNFLDTAPLQRGTFRLYRERELKIIENLGIFIERKYVIL